MNKWNYIILFILILLLYSCGTGPWYIQKNIYKTYNNKGYCSFLSLAQIKNQKSIETELDWWKIKNDSLIIENYGETKRLIKTLLWWHKGKIINDSIIEIAYQDDNYEYKPVRYKFVESDKIPELKNKARYYTKDWYLTELNKSRK